MKALTLHLDGTLKTARLAVGSVVCAIVRSPERKRILDKGHIVSEEDLASLSAVSGIDVPLLVPEEGDLHEDEAAMRLGKALAGEGIEVTGPREARARLVAQRAGLFRVHSEALRRVNSLGGVTVFTLFDGQPVAEGTLVAEAKVTPLLVSCRVIEEAEAIMQEPGLRVAAFRQVRAAALIRERISPEQARRVVGGLTRKLRWFGSSLGEVRYAPPDASSEEIADRMRQLLSEGAELLLTSGGSSTDPFDALINAVRLLPASVDRVGVPAHPGSMLWLAHAGNVPIIGVPSCGSFSEATAFDLVLPIILSGERLDPGAVAALGEGGLLKPNDHRLPKYDEE